MKDKVFINGDWVDYAYGFAWRHEDLGDNIPIPGLPGWQAPIGYDVYSTGTIPGCNIIIDKDQQINTEAFEAIPFQTV